LVRYSLNLVLKTESKNTIEHSMKGWVYIISNKSMPNIFKVGFTMKDPIERAKALAKDNSGVPFPYDVDYAILIDDPRSIEKAVHKNLHEFREGKEWFRCKYADVKAAINTASQNLSPIVTHTTVLHELLTKVLLK